MVSQPGSASQVASSASWNPFREFSITAIPFGTKPGTEALPVAEAGMKAAYDTALRNYRLQQGGSVQAAPAIQLFGQEVTGSESVVDLHIDGPALKGGY